MLNFHVCVLILFRIVSGSAIFFDQNMFYPNFFTQVPINTTIPLFGPRAWRIDNYNDPSNWLREPTNDTVSLNPLLIYSIT